MRQVWLVILPRVFCSKSCDVLSSNRDTESDTRQIWVPGNDRRKSGRVPCAHTETRKTNNPVADKNCKRAPLRISSCTVAPYETLF